MNENNRFIILSILFFNYLLELLLLVDGPHPELLHLVFLFCP